MNTKQINHSFFSKCTANWCGSAWLIKQCTPTLSDSHWVVTLYKSSSEDWSDIWMHDILWLMSNASLATQCVQLEFGYQVESSGELPCFPGKRSPLWLLLENLHFLLQMLSGNSIPVVDHQSSSVLAQSSLKCSHYLFFERHKRLTSKEHTFPSTFIWSRCLQKPASSSLQGQRPTL